KKVTNHSKEIKSKISNKHIQNLTLPNQHSTLNRLAISKKLQAPSHLFSIQHPSSKIQHFQINQFII
ncbi:MAG: hypothetical protein ACPGLV_17280, partial [Bacteroidia bacterium]